MKQVFRVLLCGAVVAAWSTGVAHALPPFKKAFEDTYVNSSDNEAFKAAVKKASCNVCHVAKEKKTVQNAYGMLLNELIPGEAKQRLDDARANGTKDEEEKKILAELAEAFKKVEGMTADGSTESYGTLLKTGKLPVGN